MKKKSYLALIMAVTLAAQAPMMAVCAEESESITVTDEGDTGIYASDDDDITVNGDITATGDYSNAIRTEEGGTVTVNGDVVATGEDSQAISSGSDYYDEDEEEDIYIPGGTITVNGDVTGNVLAVAETDITVSGDVEGYIYSNDSTVSVGGDVTGNGWSAVQAANDSTVTVDGDVTSTDWSAAEAYDGAEVTVNGDASCEQNTIWAEDSTITINGDVTGGGDCNVIDAYNATVTVNGDVTSDGYSAIHAEDGSTVTVNGDVTGNTDGIIGDNTSSVTVTGDVKTNDGSAISIQLTDNTGDGVIIVEGPAYSGEDCPVIWLGIGTDEDDNALDIDDVLASMPTIIVGTLVASDEDGNYIYYESNGTETDEEQEETLEEIYDAIYYIISVTQPDNGSISVDGTDSLYGYSVANEDDTLTVTITVNSGYELSSVSGGSVTLTLNDDGTYTLIVPRGGGVDISAVIKAIVSAATSTDSSSSSSSSSSSDDSSSSSSSSSSASVVETGLKALSVAQAGEAINTQTVPVTILSADGTATAMTLDTVINAVQTMIESAAETVQSLMTTAPTEFFTQTVQALCDMKGGEVIVNDCGTVKTVASAVDAYGNTIASAGVIENVTSGSLVLLMGVGADGTIEYVEGVIDPVTGAVLGIFENVPVTITVLVLA